MIKIQTNKDETESEVNESSDNETSYELVSDHEHNQN